MNPTEEIQERMKLIKAHQNASVSNNFTPEGAIKLSKENFEKAVKEQKLSVYAKDGLNRLKQDIQTHSSRLEKGGDFNVGEEVKKVEEFFKGLVKVDVGGSIYFLQKAEDLENDELEKGKLMPVGTISNGRKKVAEGKWIDVKDSKNPKKKDSKEEKPKHNFSGNDDAFGEQVSRARGVYDKYKDSDDKKEQEAAAKAKKFLDAAKDHDKKKKESK